MEKVIVKRGTKTLEVAENDLKFWEDSGYKKVTAKADKPAKAKANAPKKGK